MKLYATIKSERATKGQGGNHHILSILTAEIDGERQEIASMSILNNENKEYYNIQIRTPESRELFFRLAKQTKSKKQKSKTFLCFHGTPCPLECKGK